MDHSNSCFAWCLPLGKLPCLVSGPSSTRQVKTTPTPPLGREVSLEHAVWACLYDFEEGDGCGSPARKNVEQEAMTSGIGHFGSDTPDSAEVTLSFRSLAACDAVAVARPPLTRTVTRMLKHLMALDQNGDLQSHERSALVSLVHQGQLEEVSSWILALRRDDDSMTCLCPICFDEFPRRSLVRVGCGQHYFCGRCLQRHSEICVAEQRFPQCPQSGCTFELSREDVARINGPVEQWSELKLKVLLESSGDFKRCPNCRYAIEVDFDAPQQAHTCPSCDARFCSKCGDFAHRHDVPCEALSVKRGLWTDWCNGACFAHHEGEDLRATLDELRKLEHWPPCQFILDEEEKVKSCRHCPHCNRVVQRISGCDSMVCGNDTHGGNLQAGCLRKFQWAGARQYELSHETQAELDKVNKLRRDAQVMVHANVPCWCCGMQSIVGMRLRCVECEEDVSLCAECSFLAPQFHDHIFEFVRGGEPGEGTVDPRLGLWGLAMADAARREVDAPLVIVVLGPEGDEVDVDAAHLRYRLKAEIKGKQLLEHVQLLDEPLKTRLASQLSRRYLVPRPCVLVIDPRTRRLEHVWCGTGLATLSTASAVDSIVSELLERRDGTLDCQSRVELVAIYAAAAEDSAAAAEDSWLRNLQMQLNMPKYLQPEVCGVPVTLWEAKAGDPLGEAVAARHKLRDQLPCVVAMDARSRTLLEVWQGDALSRLCSPCCMDMLQDFYLSRLA